VTGSNFAGSAALYSKLPYDPLRDFAGVSQLGSTPLVLVVSPSLGPKSVKELIALAREKPGQLNFASTGLGSGTHYGGELFKLAAGISTVHVPYRGTPESLTDVMAGRVQFFIGPVLATVPLIKNGRLLGLAVTSEKRVGALPDVPTMAEAGVPKAGYEGWYAMLAPGKTPRRIVNLLAREIAQILDQPEVREKIAVQGAAAKASSPEALDRMIREEIATRKKVWEAAGVKVE
jgi:tripartite-type tricarboxylate transporter receptor subunit TctC